MSTARFALFRRLANVSLRRKLNILALVVATTAALVASAIHLGSQLQELRVTSRENLAAVTQLIAQNAAGPVLFGDSPSANNVLLALRSIEHVTGAVIDTPEQPAFATYAMPPPRENRQFNGEYARYDGWQLLTSAPIRDGATSIGIVHIVSDLRPALIASLKTSATVLVLSLVLAVSLSLVASMLLRRTILGPVEQLHAAAHRIGQTADFSYRAPVQSTDELGELTSTFNTMLDKLQANDASLRALNLTLKETLCERDRLEGELLQASRQAGMAHVATGVLHNVGNVLNSVNVSANIIRDTLNTNQRIQLLHRTLALLGENRADLPRYLTEDARGKLVPAFLVELGVAYRGVHQDLVREIEQLTGNVDHIKQIVAMQQSYAKSGGVAQRIAPSDLFAETERLAQATIRRHGVTVRHDFADAPEITTDRHQTLQILVNFLTNAVQAVKQRVTGERLVTLAITASPTSVTFAVIDNGVGIPAENLQRLFQHGFTTRRDGHGFGLHSGALAAKALGGQLAVHSDGPDRGARFSLELPLSLPANKS